MYKTKRIQETEAKIIAKALNVALPLAVCATIVGFLVLALAPEQRIRIIPVLVAVVFLVLTGCAYRKGKTRLGATLLTTAMSLSLLTGMILSGGVLAPAYGASLILIALTAWLHGPRMAVVFSIACVVAGGLFVGLDAFGLLRPPTQYSPMYAWAITSIAIISMAGVTAMPSHMLRQALEESEEKRADAEEAHRREKQARQELDAHRIELEMQNEALRTARQQLKTESARHQALFEQAGDGIFLMSLAGQIMMVNEAFARMHGYTVEEILQLGLERLDVVGTDSLADHLHQYMAGEVLHFEVEHYHKDGHVFPLAVTASLLDMDGDQVLICIHRDLTESRRAEEAMRESELNFRTLADSGRALIWTSGTDQGRTYFNRIWLAFTGRTLEQEMGLGWTEGIHPDDHQRCMHVYVSAFEQREEFSMEYRLRRYDGEYRWLIDDGCPRYNSRGEFMGYIGHCLDITERKQAEEEKEKLEARLRHAHKMESVGRLAGGVAHDFNNMLGVILGHTEIAMEHVNLDPSLRVNLLAISRAARHSADLTRQLLTFARKQTVAPKAFDLNEKVMGMLTMLQRLIGENVDLVLRPSENPWQVKMDPSQLEQIIANLCVNARDAITDIGSIVIETHNKTLDKNDCAAYMGLKPGEYVTLTVSDNGCGMDKETLAHIFEPFFTTKEVGKGTGLGLATVYGAVEQSNGFITVYSEPGQGTTFSVYLPRYKDEAVLAQEQEVASPAPCGHETILLVEDEPALLELTAMTLEKQGYTVLSASAPGDAIRLAREYGEEIDLLLTDVIMPAMNGRDLAQKLLTTHPNIKKLFMSGYAANIVSLHGVLDKEVHFIQKPFCNKNLAAKVRAVLDSR